MPTYEFRCPNGHDFERFYARISESPSEVACPVCGELATRRISGGAGLIFKGSGFYITDYGKDGKKDQRASSSTGSASRGGEAKGGESKGEGGGGGDAKGAESKAGESAGSGGTGKKGGESAGGGGSAGGGSASGGGDTGSSKGPAAASPSKPTAGE